MSPDTAPASQENIEQIYGDPSDVVHTYQGHTLDPFQREAIQSLRNGKSLLVSAPTGAGKTLIAEYALEKCIEADSQIIYTAPIKALSNQKFRDFSDTYGDRVGIMTGDVTINQNACALIMTTEVFRNTIFEDPERLQNVRYCIFDEIHYMDNEQRGTVWEESIIYAPQHIRFISLSATISNLDSLAAWMNDIRDYETEVISRDERPVPLKLSPYVPTQGFKDVDELEQLFHSRKRKQARDISRNKLNKSESGLIDSLEQKNHLPALFFVFSRRGCREKARRHKYRSLLTEAESERATDIFEHCVDSFDVRHSQDLSLLRELIPKGIAYHHAGLLPALKEIVERLFTERLINLMFATETFALGINMPARSVLFESLQKYDGTRVKYIKTREFQQMAGRAGRRGIDDVGHVYPIIDWPDFNYHAVERIFRGDVEPIKSKFGLNYATILNLYNQLGERIVEACEKSFVHFQSTDRAEHQNQQKYDHMVDQLRKRLQFLKDFNYIEDGELTSKGHFASRINGYEIHAAEYMQSGLLSELDEMNLILLMSATVFESRNRQTYEHRNQDFQRAANQAENLIRSVNQHEDELGIESITKRPEIAITALIYDWARGRPFHQVTRDCDIADGTLVRNLRMTVQLLRQVYRNLDSDEMLRRRLMKAVENVNRGVVDAEKQLSTDLY
jgi:superfamily II RNA helicase